MSINNDEARNYGLATPAYTFHWGFAISGFILGLSFTGTMILMIFITAIFVPAFGGAGPSTVAEIVMLIGLAVAVVAQFTLGYLLGKIWGSANWPITKTKSWVWNLSQVSGMAPEDV